MERNKKLVAPTNGIGSDNGTQNKKVASILHEFHRMCEQSEYSAIQTQKEALKCQRWHTITSVTIICTGLLGSSALLGFFGELAPETIQMIGAGLGLLSVICSSLELLFNLPELRIKYFNTAKNLNLFIDDCRLVVAQYEDNLIDYNQLLLKWHEHRGSFRELIKEAPFFSQSRSQSAKSLKRR